MRWARTRWLAALAILAVLAIEPLDASAQASTCLSRTPAGSVIEARLRAGVRVSVRAALEAQVAGTRARLTIPALGLEATASVGDVEFVMRETIEASPGVLIAAGTNVTVRSVGSRTAVVEVAALHVSLGRLRVPRAALALLGAVGTDRCVASDAVPSAWIASESERAAATAMALVRDAVVMGEDAGSGVLVRGGASVLRVEERSDRARVIVSDGGVRVLGWVASSALVVPPARSGGAGLGVGRIGLGCLRGEAGVRSHVLTTAATLRTRPGGAGLAELPAGTPLLIGVTRRGHVAVIEALGVRRIPSDCDRGEPTGLGWITLAAASAP